MATTRDGGSERRGLVYEFFVALAVEYSFKSMPEVGTLLKGVIADQDVIWPTGLDPKLVISVTHWGSHDAANKKFWRVHEDLFEVYSAGADSKFCSVVFERNDGSDVALCELINQITLGRGISDINCPAIPLLQARVATAAQLRYFGGGKDVILSQTRALMAEDAQFRKEIRVLGAAILRCYQNPEIDYPEAALVLSAASKRKKYSLRPTRYRTTYFKPALIALLDAGGAVGAGLEMYEFLDSLDPSTARSLMRAGLVRERSDSLSGELEATSLLTQLHEQGAAWCSQAIDAMRRVTRDRNHPLYAYHDHILDVTDTPGCQERLNILLGCASWREVAGLIENSAQGMNRVWPLEYTMIIQRAVTPSREYGMQKLSRAAGIPYVGAPISCALPRYASGDRRRLSDVQIQNLAKVIFDLKGKWTASVTTPTVIQADRKITLMKKLSVLDVLLEVALRESLPAETSIAPFIARHPLCQFSENVLAGSTEFNFRVAHGRRSCFLFIASSFEATHKHKEVSGRLRAARAAGWIQEDDYCALMVDGNILSDDTSEPRVRMLAEAGWTSILFFDQLPVLVREVRAHFELSPLVHPSALDTLLN
jgi:hypothetical protein